MIKDSQEHLNKVNETYLQHMRIAFKIAFTMLVTGFFCFIHGLTPGLFKKNWQQPNRQNVRDGFKKLKFVNTIISII